MKKLIIIIIAIAAIGAGVYVFKGGGAASLGQGVPAGAQITDIGQISADMKGKEVTVTGEMTQKCPTTGCWFYIKDSTGEIRVDTAPSGFTITDVPLHKTITVHGKVVVPESGQAELVATGVEY
jgi:uncharacterized protein YdeI (BOF family)